MPTIQCDQWYQERFGSPVGMLETGMQLFGARLEYRDVALSCRGTNPAKPDALRQPSLWMWYPS